MINKPIFPVDYNLIRRTIVNVLRTITCLDENHVIEQEPETQNSPRPTRPYLAMKIIGPAVKSGTDSIDAISGTLFNSGGNRKMTISFNAYGRSHEEAYNYMELIQCYFNAESVLETLRRVGIAVWTIGNVSDLSALLNTGFEGRCQMDIVFGIAANITEDLGAMEHVDIQGNINNTIPVAVQN